MLQVARTTDCSAGVRVVEGLQSVVVLNPFDVEVSSCSSEEWLYPL